MITVNIHIEAPYQYDIEITEEDMVELDSGPTAARLDQVVSRARNRAIAAMETSKR